MVDSMAKATSDGAVTRIAATTPVAATPPAVNPAAAPTPADLVQTGARTGGLARSLAASAPVDADRVATIKKAIAEGRFPILPATVADRLLALKLQWKPDDAA